MGAVVVILLVSPPEDDHSATVASALRGRGIRAEVVDVGSILASTSVELEYGDGPARRLLQLAAHDGSSRTIDLSRVTTGWWRRNDAPRLTRLGADLDGSPLDSSEVLESALAALDIAWINHPSHDRAARRRPLLWSAADRAGLDLPHTVVTSDPAVAHRFAIRHLRRGIVAKALTRHADDWSGAIEVSGVCALDELVESTLGELVLQERVPGVDVRVLVAGATVFSVELARRPADVPLDLALYRTPGLARAVDLPSELVARLQTMLGHLGLVQASVDLRRTPDGGYRFLDLDTVAQWLPIEEATGLPITASFVDELVERETVAVETHLSR